MSSVPWTALRRGLKTGVGKCWRSFIWISRIIVPISFLMTLIQLSGLLHRIDFLLSPITRLINLPGEAALPLLTGMLINEYTAIGVMTALPFSPEQMTLIAIYIMTAHSLITEGVIEQQSGTSAIKMIIIRIATAFLTVLIVSKFLHGTEKNIALPMTTATATPLLSALKVWGVDTLKLLIKIFFVVTGIMMTLESLKTLGWVGYLFRFFRPLMLILGLSRRTAMLWVTASLFGLTYCGAVIVEEAKKEALTKEELERLHISIGINHSIIEDPAIFMALGLPAFWIWVPRFAAAILAVQTYRALRYLKKKLSGKNILFLC